MRRSGGVWTAPNRITTTDDDWPALAIDAAGRAHVAFQRFATLTPEMYRGQLFYGTNKTGAWQFERVVGAFGDFEVGPPAIALSKAGVVHIAAGENPTGGGASGMLYAISGSIGAWGVAGAINGALDYPSMAFDGSGVLHVAYRSYLGDWAGIEHRASFEPALNADLIERTETDDAPSLDVDGAGRRHLAYQRIYGAWDKRGVYYGDDSGGWSFSRVQYGGSSMDVLGGRPDLVVTSSGSARIIDRDSVPHVPNAAGSWGWWAPYPFGRASLSADASGPIGSV